MTMDSSISEAFFEAIMRNDDDDDDALHIWCWAQ